MQQALPHLRGPWSLPRKKVWQVMYSVLDTTVEATGLSCFLHCRLILFWEPVFLAETLPSGLLKNHKEQGCKSVL